MAHKEDFDEDDSRGEFEMIIMLAMMKSAVVRIGEAVGSIAVLWRPIGLAQPSHRPQSTRSHPQNKHPIRMNTFTDQCTRAPMPIK
jgi:hypothetical protein